MDDTVAQNVSFFFFNVDNGFLLVFDASAEKMFISYHILLLFLIFSISIFKLDPFLSSFDSTFTVVLKYCFSYLLLLQIVVHKNSPRGIHFRRAGPRQRVCSRVFMHIVELTR